jgi:hypothetical protein
MGLCFPPFQYPRNGIFGREDISVTFYSMRAIFAYFLLSQRLNQNPRRCPLGTLWETNVSLHTSCLQFPHFPTQGHFCSPGHRQMASEWTYVPSYGSSTSYRWIPIWCTRFCSWRHQYALRISFGQFDSDLLTHLVALGSWADEMEDSPIPCKNSPNTHLLLAH